MEGVTGMMARLSHMQRVAAGWSAMYRTRVFFSFRVTAAVATSRFTPLKACEGVRTEKLGAGRVCILVCIAHVPNSVASGP